MTTIVNSPNPGTNTTDSGTGFLVGIIILILLIIAFFIWGLPAIRGNSGPDQINVSIPAPTGGNGGGTGGGNIGGGTQ